MLTFATVEAARRRANDDGEFRLAARFWTTSLRIAGDTTAFTLQIRDGAIIQAMEGGGADAVACEVKAPDQVWTEMLKSMPRPFYQDLYGAQTWHGLRMSGDAALSYYPAMRRFVELLRETSEGRPGA